MQRPAIIALTLTALLLAGCAGPGEENDRATGDGSGTGPITLVVGREGSAYLQSLLDRWNREHPAERATLLTLPEAADEQRAQMVANLQAKSDRYDVLALDVILTAEFADSGWIIPLERSMFPLDRFLPPVVETALYKGRLWAVPYSSNAGLLYYRKDILDKEHLRPPTTWAELREQARKLSTRHDIGGYAGQFLAYEGLTVNFAEALQSAGGKEITDPDGTRVTMDVDKAGAAIGFLQQGLREGWIPREALTYKEEESRLAFQEGRLLFARNWPHAYGSAAKSGVGGKFAVTGLPGRDGPGSSSLGGYNLAISSYSKKQRSALAFIRYFTGLETQRRVLTEGSSPPVWAELYDDPELIRRFPYLPVLKKAILTAQPRPVSADYDQVSLTIASAVSRALTPPFEEHSGDIAASMKTELTEIIKAR
ncbi:ABC transporter substrate-binding protein [Spongiactinospora sp. TRM90649]|uniref:ABC transporter substrate-binding protein n=1 Tax=Spongiactinospora sp. TRM90649 TaxID=3031114 RepID=UPI0023F8911D|nr:ABC transporter substrate-binding protein [Spongiactinospora sp. TRM90649]MDF5752517.1 ABC transporter substrate-binding protein [Spongiactinospora sp. TRM90649]